MIKFPKIPNMIRSSRPRKPQKTWKKYVFRPDNLVKDVVPNSQGIYILFNGQNKPIYVGHSSVLRHRLQSYYQDDCFKEHKTKKPLRNKIRFFAYKKMPLKNARKIERDMKSKMRFNYK